MFKPVDSENYPYFE